MSDSTEFGTWFDVKFNGPFVPEAKVRGVIVPTRVNAEVAKAQQGYDGLAFEITIEQMEPERLFSFRWHPKAVEREVDYSAEPTTLVVFALEDVGNGVMLTVTESGFAFDFDVGHNDSQHVFVDINSRYPMGHSSSWLGAYRIPRETGLLISSGGRGLVEECGRIGSMLAKGNNHVQ